jgi:hypothetical protein
MTDGREKLDGRKDRWVNDRECALINERERENAEKKGSGGKKYIYSN